MNPGRFLSDGGSEGGDGEVPQLEFDPVLAPFGAGFRSVRAPATRERRRQRSQPEREPFHGRSSGKKRRYILSAIWKQAPSEVASAPIRLMASPDFARRIRGWPNSEKREHHPGNRIEPRPLESCARAARGKRRERAGHVVVRLGGITGSANEIGFWHRMPAEVADLPLRFGRPPHRRHESCSYRGA